MATTTTLLDEMRRRDQQRRDKQAAARAAAERTYRALLARADRPKAADADDLADVMGTLGLSPSDVAADLAALRDADELRGRLLPPGRAAELDAAAEAERAAVKDEVRAEVSPAVAALSIDGLLGVHALYVGPPEQAMKRRKAWVARYQNAGDEATRARNADQHARDRLAKLAQERPLAFGPGEE